MIGDVVKKAIPVFKQIASRSPYETTIVRRRQIQDPNIPDFENQERLKWAKWTMLRDVKRRHLNANYWQYRMNLQNISSCQTLPSVVRELALEERNSTPKGASINHINNRCAITGRGRGKVYKYRLSRIVYRDLADHGLLSGIIRAKWG